MTKDILSWNDVKERYLEFHRIDKFTENMAIDVDFGYWLVNNCIVPDNSTRFTMELNEHILFMAFRYALGRSTYAVTELVDTLIDKWTEMPLEYQELIKHEIAAAIEAGNAGMEMDVEQWKKVLNLQSNQGEGCYDKR